MTPVLRRISDVLLSTGILLAASPLLGITALLVRMDGSPALYRQPRAGLKGKVFQILKFRSMTPNQWTTAELATVHGQVRQDHAEVTAVGRWIRRFKIDEVPQFINVLRGEMSIIGPRPTVCEQVDEYTDFQRRRLDVLPGLTGWTQINGGTEYDWPERIQLDVWYVAHRSLALDLKILLRTGMVILLGERRNAQALAVAKAYAESQSATEQATAR